jgi:hypothetical protein
LTYSPTEHGIEGLCSISLRPNGARLFFSGDAALSEFDLK